MPERQSQAKRNKVSGASRADSRTAGPPAAAMRRDTRPAAKLRRDTRHVTAGVPQPRARSL